jgi:hypothetical protein
MTTPSVGVDHEGHGLNGPLNPAQRPMYGCASRRRSPLRAAGAAVPNVGRASVAEAVLCPPVADIRQIVTVRHEPLTGAQMGHQKTQERDRNLSGTRRCRSTGALGMSSRSLPTLRAAGLARAARRPECSQSDRSRARRGDRAFPRVL